MKKYFLISLIGLVFVACDDDDKQPVSIRLSNISEHDFEDVYMVSPGGSADYGDLAAGSLSEYMEFSYSYSYAFVELLIDSDTFTLQPIDFVGESPLSAGHYTYQLEATSALGDRYGTLSLELIED